MISFSYCCIFRYSRGIKNSPYGSFLNSTIGGAGFLLSVFYGPVQIHSAVLVFYSIYGFFIEKLSASADTASTKSITNGAMYEPLLISRVFANVAMKDATIRLKLMIE